MHENILIAKLSQNQEIWVNLICEKGIGKTHAKWQPVATAFYKLMPQIQLKERISGQRAGQLKKLCPTGVFDIEDGQCVVKSSEKCTTCRECVREANGFDKAIELSKVSNHFICKLTFANGKSRWSRWGCTRPARSCSRPSRS